ncbi:MAG TPA: hypothetical protein VIJ87_03455, partial [Pyrinomonadaceae bacterium]
IPPPLGTLSRCCFAPNSTLYYMTLELRLSKGQLVTPLEQKAEALLELNKMGRKSEVIEGHLSR